MSLSTLDIYMNRRSKLIRLGVFFALLVIIGIAQITLWPVYPSQNLADYPYINGTVKSASIEKYMSHSIRHPDTPYYEFAIYLDSGERFFLRNPHEDALLKYWYRVISGNNIEINYLKKTENSRGHRIVNLISSDQTVYTINEALLDQEEKSKFMSYFVAAALFIAFVLFALAYEES